MQSVAIQDFEAHPADFIAAVEAGANLTLIRGGKAIATLAPTVKATRADDLSEATARERLLALMDSGIDLGGVPPTRDEMHERF